LARTATNSFLGNSRAG